jgi:2-polyprenyl-6-methoxyphenol hydroxylase-like FAD-dependent oxidoreductase
MHAIIVGGGIGGLTTALALNAQGIDATVFEAVQDIRPLGVGINLLPHAVSVLAELGLLESLGAHSIETKELIFFSKHGKEIWREPRGLAAGYPVPQFSTHRGEFQALLLATATERLGQDHIKTGMSYRRHNVLPHGGGVDVWFENRKYGTEVGPVHADLLIGADGIHSTVRSGFYPAEGPPRWSGAILWRAAIESAPFLSGRSMIMAGHSEQKLVVYPISKQALDQGRSLTNWIAELRIGAPGAPVPSRESWNKPGRFEDFMPSFQGWAFDWLDFPSLAAKTPEAFEFPMVDRDPVEQWSFGSATLLGDAAHPMYPVGSNGASQAILDAETISRHLAEAHDDIPGALKAYQTERLPATAALVAANRRQGPEEVMQIVEDRAPNGFDQLEDIISQAELMTVASKYKQVAGFYRAAVDKVAHGRN